MAFLFDLGWHRLGLCAAAPPPSPFRFAEVLGDYVVLQQAPAQVAEIENCDIFDTENNRFFWVKLGDHLLSLGPDSTEWL